MRLFRIALGMFLALLSAFFVFYTARLLYVTSMLRAIRAGGQGAYLGAIVFPLFALVCGWAAWRCFRRARHTPLVPVVTFSRLWR